MPLLEVSKLVLQLALLALVIYGVAYLRKGVRQLRGEIAAAAIVRETLAEEFPHQAPPTDSHGGLTLLHGGSGRAPRKAHALQMAAVAAGLAVVSLVAVAVFANPVVMNRPAAAPKPEPIDSVPAASSTVQGVTPEPVVWKAKQRKVVEQATPKPTPTVTARSRTVRPTLVPPSTPRPRRTPAPTPTPTVEETVGPELPPIPPVTVCAPSPLGQVCVGK